MFTNTIEMNTDDRQVLWLTDSLSPDMRTGCVCTTRRKVKKHKQMSLVYFDEKKYLGSILIKTAFDVGIFENTQNFDIVLIIIYANVLNWNLWEIF